MNRLLRARAAPTFSLLGLVVVPSLTFLLTLLMAAATQLGCAGKKPVLAEPPVAEITSDAGPPTEPQDAAPPPPPKSLYERLGGKEGVLAVVDSFTKNLVADPRVNKLFIKSKDHLEHFKEVLADMLCEASGGGCHYAGKSMRDAHKGMAITEAQFDAVVEDLKLALDEKGVGETDKSELFIAIAPMREDIVEKKTKKK
jgi:hemoglobin